jgi:hypothetical protein
VSDETERIARRIRDAADTVRAPDRLHERIAAQTSNRAPRRRRSVLALAGGLAGGVAVAAVALVLVLGSGGPSMDDAVAVALRTPTTSAPAVDPTNTKRLEAHVGDVWFPNYGEYAGWRPIGSRTDEIDGRRAVTVAYQGAGGPVNYTIVDGAPLEVPEGVPWRDYPRFRAAVLRPGVITWEKGGRTCILAGENADLAALLHAADRS